MTEENVKEEIDLVKDKVTGRFCELRNNTPLKV